VLGHELPEAEVHDLRDGVEERENPGQIHLKWSFKMRKTTINAL